MTVLDERPVDALTCVKRPDAGGVCTGRPVVRYAVGPVCSQHQVFGAQVLEWLVIPDADLELTAAAPLDPAEAVEAFLRLDRLPDAARPKAAQHADADPGEANTARLVAYKAGKTRARVLEYLVLAGPRGTTAIEAWRWYQATHSPNIERYSVAPRLTELVTDKWAVKTGELRNVRGPGYPPEEVYVLSARGRRETGVTW